MPLASVNGTSLYYELHGPETAPLLVFSNGIFMSTGSWAYQVAELKKYFHVLLYDCRGMWQSEHPTGAYSMDLHADDLAGLLQALGVGSAHIAGISYGGEVSLNFAARYPSMTRSLIVSSAVSEIHPLLQAFGESWLYAAQKRDAEMLYRVSLPLNFSQGYLQANPKAGAASLERFKQIDLVAVEQLMLAFLNLNLTPLLGEIQAPALVLVGEEDRLKPRAYAEIIAANIHQSELAILPAAGHAVCLEQPKLFNDLLLGFLTRQSLEVK